MKLSLGARSATKIVTTAEMKEFLKVDTLITADDTLIDNLVKGAMIEFEEYARIALLTQTWNLYLDKIGQKIELPRPPLQTVEHFYWYDENYTKTEMTAALYLTRVLSAAEPGYILRKPSVSWEVYTTNGDGIKIEYTAGFGAAASAVPQDIIEAIMSIVAWRYENRGSKEIPGNAQAVMDRYKVYY